MAPLHYAYRPGEYANLLPKWTETDIRGPKWIEKWICDENRRIKNIARDA
jgi:hypothetical protein